MRASQILWVPVRGRSRVREFTKGRVCGCCCVLEVSVD